MTRTDLLTLADQHYPRGPEKIAALRGYIVRHEPIDVDGWYVRGPSATIIRINSSAPKVRQRFTLSHEIAHLFEGTQSSIGVEGSEVYNPWSLEEIRANALASELLLPTERIRLSFPDGIVDRAAV